MHLRDEPGRLVIWNTSRLHWIPGVLLVAAGAWVLLAAAGLVRGTEPYTVAVRAVAGVVGGIGLGYGVWVCWRSPLASVVVDRIGQTVTLTRRGLFHTFTQRYPADAVADARVTKERDGRGSPLYRVELLLHSGSVIPISLIGPRDREGCMRAAEHLWKALDLPRA